MTSEFVIGWELMFHSVQKDIKTKEDVLIVLIHWALIKSRFRCIGLGDDVSSLKHDVFYNLVLS